MITLTRVTSAAAALALATAGLTVAAPQAGALLEGSFLTPADGSHVSGIVHLSYSSLQDYVLFSTPSGSMRVAVAAGSASYDWPSTSVPNGIASLGAQECTTTQGCGTYSTHNVAVDNPQVSYAPTPGSTLPSPVVTVQGSANVVENGALHAAGVYDVSYNVGGDYGHTVTGVGLPYALHIASPNLPTGTYPVNVTVTARCAVSDCATSSTSAAWYLHVVDTTKPGVTAFTVTKYFHPVRDGFADSITSTVTATEAGTARLVVYRKGKVVSVGFPTRLQPGYATTVLSRPGLAPGTYTVAADVRDLAGNRTLSARRPAVGDAKRLVTRPARLTLIPATAAYTDRSGNCSSAVLGSGSSLKLDTNSRCHAMPSDTYSSTASVVYTPPVVTPLGTTSQTSTSTPLQLVRNLLVTVHYAGGALTGQVTGSSGTPQASDTGSGGTLSLRVAAPQVGSDGRLQIQLSTPPGKDSTITGITLTYQRRQLQ